MSIEKEFLAEESGVDESQVYNSFPWKGWENKEIISKELLSEVLSERVVEIIEEIEDYCNMGTSHNVLYYTYASDYSSHFERRNIHELAHNTIEWLESKDCWIRRVHKNIYELVHRSVEVYSIDTKNSLHVPFMCAQWMISHAED